MKIKALKLLDQVAKQLTQSVEAETISPFDFGLFVYIKYSLGGTTSNSNTFMRRFPGLNPGNAVLSTKNV